MEHRVFKSSPVIAGCMRWGNWGARLNAVEMEELINHCLSAGINTFDHADIYGGEYSTADAFGEVIADRPSLRSQMKIISKCGICLPNTTHSGPRIKYYDTSARHIIESAERALLAFRTDRLDLLLIHRPDPLMHPAEIADAIFRLKQSGKILHAGVSNFRSAQLRMMSKFWTVEVNQLQISVEHPHALFDGTVDACMELGIQVQAWSPIGGGSINADAEDERYRKIYAVSEIIAQKYQCSVTEVMLAWVRAHPAGIVPVLGSSKIERLKSGLSATSIQLEREEWFMMLRASTGRDVA